MIDNKYLKLLVENQLGFIELYLVHITIGLLVSIPLDQIVKHRFHPTILVINNHRIPIDHCLRDCNQPLVPLRFVEDVLWLDADLADEPLDGLLLRVQDVAGARGHQGQDRVLGGEVVLGQAVVVPVRDLVLLGVELGEGLLVVDLDAQLVEFEVEDAHQFGSLVFVADARVDHA